MVIRFMGETTVLMPNGQSYLCPERSGVRFNRPVTYTGTAQRDYLTAASNLANQIDPA